jgi:hypothetical protein
MSEAALSIPARIAPRPLTWPHRQRLPAGDGASTLPGLRGVGDAGKQSVQLDGSRQLTTPVESGADRCGLCLGDDEHPGSMGIRIMTGKRLSDAPSRQPGMGTTVRISAPLAR